MSSMFISHPRVAGLVVVVLAVVLLTAATVTAAATGDGWRPQASASGTAFEDLAFADDSHGWAVGADAVRATTDGGGTWFAQDPGLDAYLEAVAVGDATHAWVFGGGGTIAATTDGGATWHAQGSGVDESLDGATAVDRMHAWAVGRQGALLSTTDGGSTWHAAATPEPTMLRDVCFVDPQRGWAVGGSGVILATTDGGVTWSAQDSGCGVQFSSVSFVDELHGWAAGSSSTSTPHGVIVATTDGGATWSRRARLAGECAITDIDFRSATSGWATGYYLWGRAHLLATTDGGHTWELRGVARRYLSSVAAGSGSRAWAAGSSGVILATVDDGLSSDVTPPKTTVDWNARIWHNHALTVPAQATDAVGGSGVAYVEHSSDAMASWSLGRLAAVAAPRSHANDGVNVLWFRSVDRAGNIEAAVPVRVRIDTRAPHTHTDGPVSAASGAVVGIRVRLDDAGPGGATGRVRINAGAAGSCQAGITLVRNVHVRVGEWTTVRFVCDLDPGMYTFAVWGTDTAGNHGGNALGALNVY